MTAFNHTSLDIDGKHHKGIIEADSPRQARNLLRQRRLTPVSVEEAVRTQKHTNYNRNFSSRLTLNELSLTTRQLAVLTEAGLPIEQALLTLSRQSEKAKVRSIIAAIRSQVMEGKSLAESLEAYPATFPGLYRTSIKAAERAGNLDIVLHYLADFLENSVHARQKIVLALVYPAILLSVSIAVIAFLLAYVVPDMVKVFSDSGKELPFLTTALMGISSLIRNFSLPIIAFVIAAYFAGRKYLSSTTAGNRFDQRILKLPLLGKLILDINTSRFVSTLGMLQKSGVPLLHALSIASSTISNRHIQAQSQEILRMVQEGRSLSHAFEQCKLFPPLLITLSASGEASGKLGIMLNKAGKILQTQVETRIAVLLKVLEPAVLLLMGGIVLLLVLAIIQPIINLNQLVK